MCDTIEPARVYSARLILPKEDCIMPTSPRAVSHSGNDLYREIILPTTQAPFKVTYWDVWILALLVGDFGDWDSIERRVPG